jgi:cytochrome P450 family 135
MPPRLPPGPDAGALTQELRFHRDPLGDMLRARERYGPVYSMRLPTARRVVAIAVPDAVERVLHADPQIATAGAGRRRVLGMAAPASVLGADREEHRIVRGRVAPVFQPQALERHAGAMAALAAEHAGRWPRGRPFRLLPRVRTLVDDVFVRLVVGVRDDARATALVLAIRRMLWSPGNPPLSLPTGNRGLLGVLGEALYRRRAVPVAKLLRAELADRRRAGGDGDGDLLGCMLRDGVPDDQAVEELLPLLMAGQEPPAVGLTWLLDRLARHPGADPRDDAFVRETFRVRPPVVAVLRPLTAPLTVAGYDLPPGTVVMLPIPLLHRDPELFPDPHAFRPERFTGGGEPPAAYLPFGGGVRRCLGEALAQTQIRTMLPALLDRVRLRALSREPERPVVRATVLPPQRSALMVAR